MAVLHDGSPPFTCHKGSGSRIDHIWCSDSCLPVSCHFGIQTNPFTDHVHAILELGFWNQQQSVERLAPRQSYSFDHLTTPEQAIDFYTPDESYSALNIQDVNKAAAIWSRQAEAILVQLHQFQCGNLPRKGQPRGKIQLDATRQLPRVFQAHANCLQLRRLGKAYRRAIEVCKAQASPRLLRAWRNLSEALQACPSQWSAALLRRPPSIAEAVAQILQKAMDFVQAEQRQHRLKLWKQQMRSSATKASAWRKLRQATKEKPILQHQKHYACIAVKVNGRYTVDPARQLAALMTAWDKVFGRHS